MKTTVENLIDILLSKANLKKPSFKLKISDKDIPGYFHLPSRRLVIPSWSLRVNAFDQPDATYCIYYIAHELAHACAGYAEVRAHCEVFYYYFNRLCPKALKHWEISYLPENRRLIIV